MTSPARIVALVAVLVALGPGVLVHAQQAQAPRLVVVLVIDQMRSDYIDRYKHQWDAGLKRLLTEGAWFRRAAYPYLGTVTCTGHATISTGTFPAQHGMILNGWWDREQAALIRCTDDTEHATVSYGEPLDGGVSAGQLAAATLSDEIRAQLPGTNRVVALSLKARSAAMLAGRAADVALWFDDRGSWVTSTAYTDQPVPFVQAFIDANPVIADADRIWTRALPVAEYLFEDDVPFERPGDGWSPVFPHQLGDDGGPSPAFFRRWQRTPLSDVYLGRLAETALFLNVALLIVILIAPLLSALLIGAVPSFYSLVNNDPDVLALGIPYLQIRAMGIVFVAMNFAFRGYWNAVDMTRLYMTTLVSMHALNILLNYIIIQLRGGLCASLIDIATLYPQRVRPSA